MSLKIDRSDLTRWQLKSASEEDRLHAQAQVALEMAAKEADRYGMKLLREQPNMPAITLLARITGHLKSLVTTLNR